nr:DUF116 domain-containing protein [candidate division Zixibacteria bacterium]
MYNGIMTAENTREHMKDRKLGDEWLDWDGRSNTESTETDWRVFLGLAIISTLFIIITAGLFLWLIYPRLISLGSAVARLFSAAFLVFSGILILWLLFFVTAAVLQRPITRMIFIPQMVNRLLSIVLAVGKFFGVSRDRLTNSFLKINNIFLGSRSLKTVPERLLVLLPRCLTKDNFRRLREMRDNYGFNMFTVGGGTEARLKIKELRPRIIIAIACERDLLSGFREVNTHIPVIGFPNKRPEGPCKNTCVNLDSVEEAIRNCLD